MAEENLRPRGTSEIIDAAFALYRRDFSQYVLVAALASTPGLILQLVVTGGTQPTTLADFLKLVPSLLVSVVSMTLMSAVVQKGGSQVYLGGSIDLPAIVRQVLPKLVPLIISGILFGFMVVIGFLFIIVGALFVAVRWFAIAQVIVLEDKGPLACFSRSFALTRGADMQWHVLKTLLLLAVLYIIFTIFISAVAALVSFPPGRLMVQTALTVVTSPVLALSSMLLYYDLRIRKEAFDLERMTDALGTAAAPGVEGASV